MQKRKRKMQPSAEDARNFHFSQLYFENQDRY